MKLSYFHVADDVINDVNSQTAVVIDVLRATTTIAWALNNGAEAVQTFADLSELRKSASKWPESSRLLLGERGGKKIEGFDLGNSPVSVAPEIVSGKRLFMSTTNGTRSLESVKDVDSLFTLALPNRSAVAERLLINQPGHVWILGSGWESSYSLEDSLAAGALAASLMEKSPDGISVINDELTAAIALWKVWENDIELCLRKATHGQRLIGLGDHDEVFRCCAQLDCLSVVPTQSEQGVLCAG